jgi:hypothetical protein
LAVIRLYHSGVIKLSPWVGRGKPGGYHQKVILLNFKEMGLPTFIAAPF